MNVMNAVHSIVSKSAGIISYISKNIRAEEPVDHNELLKVAYGMYRLNPESIFFTCPVSHKDFFYLSQNCFSLFGYTAEYMQSRFRDPAAYFSQVHNADIGDLHDCMSFVQQFIKTEVMSDPQHFRCFFYYRIRRADGSYIYLQDQKATFAAANHTIYYTLLREMDAGSPFHGVKLEIYRERPLFEKLVSYKPAVANNKLTLREADLVNLMRQGLTTKEIASHLNLSSNTVRNIKSKMFSKYNVNNSIELLNIAG
jgi:DNA-binding CsgD family transcriptional regulator